MEVMALATLVHLVVGHEVNYNIKFLPQVFSAKWMSIPVQWILHHKKHMLKIYNNVSFDKKEDMLVGLMFWKVAW